MLKLNFSVADASSSNEAVHLQQRLRSLSTELVTLRNRLHVQNPPAAVNNSSVAASNPGVVSSPTSAAPQVTAQPCAAQNNHCVAQPAVPPRQLQQPQQLVGVAPPVTNVEVHKQPHKNVTNVSNTNAELEDLIHLPGPLTEDAVMKCLHARFNNSNFYVSKI